MFIEEAKRHLERIASGLLVLEAAPGDQSAIEGILREAHTMKGAAGMVGMMRVSRLAHRLEDLLVELRAGTRQTTPELTDSMLLVVDGLSRLVLSPSSGEPDASDEAAMEGLLPPPVQPAPAPAAPQTAPPPLPARGVKDGNADRSLTLSTEGEREKPMLSVGPLAPHPREAPSDAQHEVAATLEVPVARIDELNRLVGEASAAQLRVGHVFDSELHLDPDGITEYRELTKVINRLQEVTE